MPDGSKCLEKLPEAKNALCESLTCKASDLDETGLMLVPRGMAQDVSH